eukprot:gene5185-33580_t
MELASQSAQRVLAEYWQKHRARPITPSSLQTRVGSTVSMLLFHSGDLFSEKPELVRLPQAKADEYEAKVEAEAKVAASAGLNGPDMLNMMRLMASLMNAAPPS